MSKKIKKYNIRKGTVFVPVSDLGFFDNNPKKFESKQYKKLLESIKKNGIRENLLVNKTTMTILNGNQRFKVSLQLGIKEVPVTFLEIPEKDEGKVLVELNECLTAKDDKAMEELIKNIRMTN